MYAFGTNENDGEYPYAGLIADKNGNLFGTTWLGETCSGTVFELTPHGKETILHCFTAGGSDGWAPYGGLIADRKGNFYGTTQVGGSTACGGDGCGTVFELTPDGTETILYAFQGGSDGANPYAGLLEKDGTLYGTTNAGGGTGCGGSGCGTVFKVSEQ